MATANPNPRGLHTLTPNLTLRDCARAIEFYKKALGAQEASRFMSPAASPCGTPSSRSVTRSCS